MGLFRFKLEVDDKIVTLVKKNNQKTILDLYHLTFNVLMSTAVRYKVNQEDQMTIVNNSFLKIVKNIDKYEVGTKYFSWAKRIVHNEVINDFKKQKNYRTLFEMETEADIEFGDTSNEFEEDVEAEVLQEMLNLLPPASKVVFNLFAIEGFTNKEIADELNIGTETVKWHLKSARKKIRIAYKEMYLNA